MQLRPTHSPSLAHDRLQASALRLARPQRQRRRAAPQPPTAHFISAGGEGGEATYGEVVGSGEFSGALGSGSGSSARAAARQEGWQRRWGMVAMCFVAFMVSEAEEDGTSPGLHEHNTVRLCGLPRKLAAAACVTPPPLNLPRPPGTPPLPPARSCATWTA